MQDSVSDFVAALQKTAAALTDVRDRLDGARIPDASVGRLFEAHAVRDAYHARLPLIAANLDQAASVVTRIVTGLRADWNAPDPDHPQPPASIPGQPDGSAS
jgi:hypothetical protein